MKLKPVNRVSVVESVTERLLSLISSGKVKPGERLPSEHELAEQLGVGRTSIREALRSLSILGLIEPRAGRGTIVISPLVISLGSDLKKVITQWALLDIFEVRILLETHAAARAARRATPEDIGSIERAALAVEKKAKAGKSYFSENLNFHLRIADASHNPVLAHSLSSMISSLRDVRESATLAQSVQADLDDHRRILGAIRSREPGSAEQAMRLHLERNVGELVGATKALSRQLD